MKSIIYDGSLKKTVKIAGLAYILIIIIPFLSMLIIDPKITGATWLGLYSTIIFKTLHLIHGMKNLISF